LGLLAFGLTPFLVLIYSPLFNPHPVDAGGVPLEIGGTEGSKPFAAIRVRL
jgi:hypothetical protein